MGNTSRWQETATSTSSTPHQAPLRGRSPILHPLSTPLHGRPTATTFPCAVDGKVPQRASICTATSAVRGVWCGRRQPPLRAPQPLFHPMALRSSQVCIGMEPMVPQRGSTTRTPAIKWIPSADLAQEVAVPAATTIAERFTAQLGALTHPTS